MQLKLTWYPSKEDDPILLFLLHVIVKLVRVLFTATGLVGGPGNVKGSGDLKNPIFGFVGDSSRKLAFQIARPFSELAIHVYTPLSFFSKSAEQTYLNNHYLQFFGNQNQKISQKFFWDGRGRQ